MPYDQDNMNRANMITSLGWTRPGEAPNAEYMAAITAVEAYQRCALSADHPAFLTREAADAALDAFVALSPTPVPLYDSHRVAIDALGRSGGPHVPVIGQSVSYAVTHFAQKYEVTSEEAEAVLAHVKPQDGHRKNTLLATQVIKRFASDYGIRVKDAIEVFREGY